MLNKIQFTDEDELYILGDIMDRGPNSIDIYYFVKAMPNVHMIKGNHEIMMRQSLAASLKYNDLDSDLNNAYRLWKQNGATGTVNSIREFLQKDSIPYEEYFDIKKEFVNSSVMLTMDNGTYYVNGVIKDGAFTGTIQSDGNTNKVYYNGVMYLVNKGEKIETGLYSELSCKSFLTLPYQVSAPSLLKPSSHVAPVIA